jgi:hypothetical protein
VLVVDLFRLNLSRRPASPQGQHSPCPARPRSAIGAQA